MTRERIRLQHEQQTMLMTLYLHARDARDARTEHPILGDTHAGPLLERIDYDFARLQKLKGNQPLIVGRAKAIDDSLRDYLTAHPDAVVLHLGCGLDSRVLRIDLGPTVAWSAALPAREGVTTIAASVRGCSCT
jgi:O-methyltransferase